MKGPTIAVLHGLVPASRQTTIDHVLCFMRYLAGARVFHHHIRQAPSRLLEHGRIDLVVLSYCFLSRARRSEAQWQAHASRYAMLRELGCPIVALPQDDYKAHDFLDRWFTELDVDLVLSPIETDLGVLYPSSLGRTRFGRQLTGYVDARRMARIGVTIPPIAERPIDLGTRVSFTSACLGRHARKKGVQALGLRDRLQHRGLAVDVSTDRRDAIVGERWFDFLASCRFTVGRKGGASIPDPDGSIGERTRVFLEQHPGASFDEIEHACFPGLDGRHVFEAISPRLFDAAATRTCQILAPDDYLGVLQPWVHYVPLEEDFSNLEDVVAVMRDLPRAQAIADACYEALIGSGRFTYEAFARDVVALGLGESQLAGGAGVATRVSDAATDRLMELPIRFGMPMLEAFYEIPARLAARNLLGEFRDAAELARRYEEQGIDLPPARLGVEVPLLAGLKRIGPLALEYATIAAATGATEAVLAWVDAALAATPHEERSLPWVDPWAFEPDRSDWASA